jgi:plasmid maintenance system killer protein
MTIVISDRATKAIAHAPAVVRKAFYKQLRLLATNLSHPSLRAKKYDERRDIWQGRVNRNWRLYFAIKADECFIIDVVPHPK